MTAEVRGAPTNDTGAKVVNRGADESDTREAFDLGIVFIHGMGDTKPGDTLIRFLNPAVEWIKRWSNRNYTLDSIPAGLATIQQSVIPIELPDSGNTLPTIDRIDRTVLRSADPTQRNYTPPHSRVRLSRAEESKTWLAVEAWWAEEFTPPQFGDVASWALGVAPFLLVRHFRPSEYQIESRWGRWLFQPFRFALSLFLVVAFEFLIVLLLVASLIPGLQNYVKGLILNLIGSFGDVMMYTADAMRSTAIRSAVERSFEWMERTSNCRRLVVVGYSLGSIIGYDILNRHAVGASSYITYGCPLKKASIALQLQRNPQRASLGILTAFLGTAAGVAAAVLAFIYQERWSWQTALWGWDVAIFALILFACAAVVLRRFSSIRLARYVGFDLFAIAGALGAAGIMAVQRNPDFGFWDALAVLLLGGAACLMGGRWWRDEHPVDKPETPAGVIQRSLYWLLVKSTPVFVFTLLAWVSYLAFQLRVGEAEPWWFTVISPLAMAAILFAWLAVDMPLSEREPEASPPPAPADSTTMTSQRQIDTLNPKLKIAGARTDEPMSWLDFWASGDPFPEYGLSDMDIGSAGRRLTTISTEHGDKPAIDSRRITNRRSITSDHGVYGENPEEFVAPFAEHLLSETGPGWSMFPNSDDDRALAENPSTIRRWWVNLFGTYRHRRRLEVISLLQHAQSKRRRRVTTLGASFWLAALLPLLPTRRLYIDTFKHAVFSDWGADRPQIRFVPDDFFLIDQLRDKPETTAFMAGVLIAILAVALWYRAVCFTLWRSWDRAVEHDLFERRPNHSTNVRLRRLGFFVVALIVPICAIAWFVSSNGGDWTWIDDVAKRVTD